MQPKPGHIILWALACAAGLLLACQLIAPVSPAPVQLAAFPFAFLAALICGCKAVATFVDWRCE